MDQPLVSTRRHVGGLVTLAVLGAILYGVLHWQQLLTDYRAWRFVPTSQITTLVDQTTMTSRAQHLFYGGQPEVDTDRQRFDSHCAAPISSRTVELGCYTPGGRIYVLSLDRQELSSVINVTAAHEMLHAAYAQLSGSQKAKVDQLLEADAARLVKTNQTLQTELKNYSLSEPGQRDNELHSLLGTEYRDLSPALEDYYRQYFANRSLVVAYNEQFEAAFTSLEGQLDSLSAQIQSLRTEMQAERQSHDIASYNRNVPIINGLIRQYNQKVDQYNGLSRSLRGSQNTL